jgi:hypothetical protein
VFLSRFLISLGEHGRVRVTPPQPFEAADLAAATKLLEEWDQRVRLELSHAAPSLHSEAALWGAQRLYRACQLLVFRSPDSQSHDRRQDSDLLKPRSPSIDYSVDLALQHLPDLMRISRAAAPNEALQAELESLSQAWPLSSVGSGIRGAIDVSSFIENDALRALYVDRVIARRDFSRLDDPRVRDAVRAAIGLFSSLAPDLAAAMADTAPGSAGNVGAVA